MQGVRLNDPAKVHHPVKINRPENRSVLRSLAAAKVLGLAGTVLEKERVLKNELETVLGEERATGK